MSTLFMIAGGIMAGASQIQAGRVASAQGKFAEKISIVNEQALERQAKAEMEAAKLEETGIARKEKIFKAKQRAIIGKSGIGLAGATLSLLADTAGQFSLERNLALRRGLIRGRELRQRGRIGRVKGKWEAKLGKQTQRLSYFQAGGSILGSAGMATMKPGGSFTASGGTSSGSMPTGSYGANFPSSAYR